MDAEQAWEAAQGELVVHDACMNAFWAVMGSPGGGGPRCALAAGGRMEAGPTGGGGPHAGPPPS